MLKVLTFILFTFVVCSGCEELLFDRQPGEKLKSIPKEMRGKFISYYAYFEDGAWQYEDTSIVVIRGKKMNANTKKKALRLSDSTRLSKYGDYYFFSKKKDNYWECSVIKMEANGFIAVPLIVDFSENNDDGFMYEFMSDIKYIVVDGEERHLVKTNEDEMIRFFEEHLRHVFYLQFEVYNE